VSGCSPAPTGPVRADVEESIVSVKYPLVPVPCRHCRASRRLGALHHQPGCPLDTANLAFFRHPDLMELDLHLAAYYPEP
jgi:hypothetical protein